MAPSERAASRDVRGVVLALAALAAVVASDLAIGGRAIPSAAVLLAPMVASAVSRPVVVAGTGALALATGAALGLHDGLVPAELVSRLALVLLAAALSTGVAVARVRRERELRRADRAAALSGTLQRGLLPRTGSTEAVDVVSIYRPGQRDLLLGGDFLDVLPLPDGSTAFCIGDVSGHGPDAAALGSALRAGWRTQALVSGDPAAWLLALDRLLVAEADTDEQFATLLVGLVDPDGQIAVLANAGHPQPVLLTDVAELLELKAGPPLGMPAELGSGWSPQEVVLGVRWGLLLYTDGLIEGRRAPGSATRYGDHSLAAWLSDGERPDEVGRADLDRLFRDVEAANGQPLEDDVAVVLLRSAR